MFSFASDKLILCIFGPDDGRFMFFRKGIRPISGYTEPHKSVLPTKLAMKVVIAIEFFKDHLTIQLLEKVVLWNVTPCGSCKN
jgi:hypothetical protein